MPALLDRRHINFLIHILAWAVIGFIFLVFQPLTSEIPFPLEFWIRQALLFCLYVGAFYLNAKVWVPRFLFQNRTAVFILANIATLIAATVLLQVVEVWLEIPQLMREAFGQHRGRPPHDGIHPLRILKGILEPTILLLILILSTCITVVQKWQQDNLVRQELENQRIESELSFLKTQINPHFFFNTLNNIYILTTIDVETSRLALHKLSRMMRYVLYETQKDTVLLSQEIAFLEDYIELMKLRLTDNVSVKFIKPSSINEILIAPMIFLPFVENAFKHGVSTQDPSEINIIIKQDDSNLQLEVRNTKFNGERMALDENNGIGLQNTRRRLDLLYNGHYQLSVTEHAADNKFHVHLTLNVS